MMPMHTVNGLDRLRKFPATVHGMSLICSSSLVELTLLLQLDLVRLPMQNVPSHPRMTSKELIVKRKAASLSLARMTGQICESWKPENNNKSTSKIRPEFLELDGAARKQQHTSKIRPEFLELDGAAVACSVVSNLTFSVRAACAL